MPVGGWVLAAAVPVGFAAGFLGSLIGIGGGAVMVPLLVLLGVPVKVAAPASLLAILGTSLGGLRVLLRRGMVRWRLALLLETASGLGAVLGVYLHGVAPEAVLRLLLGGLLLASAPAVVSRAEAPDRGPGGWRGSGAARLVLAWLVSLSAGVVSALLGVGGGVLKVPMLVLVLGLGVKEAVATSKLMVGITALVGVVGYLVSGSLYVPLGLALLAGTYTGAVVSSRLLVAMRPRRVAVIAASYYIAAGLAMLRSGLRAMGYLR